MAAALNPSIERLLLHQANASETQPAPWQERLARTATQAGSVGVLAALAARADSPASLLETFAEHPHAKVRIALLGRPGLDSGVRERIIATERRAQVLAALASSDDPDTREHVLRMFRTRPTRALAEALLGKTLDRETSLVVLRTLAPRWADLSSGRSRALTGLMNERLADTSAAQLLECAQGQWDLARLLLVGHSDLDEPSMVELVSLLRRYSAEPAAAGWKWRILRDWETAIAHPLAETPRVAAALGAAVAHDSQLTHLLKQRIPHQGLGPDAPLAQLRSLAQQGIWAAVDLLLRSSEVSDDEAVELVRQSETRRLCDSFSEYPEHVRDLILQRSPEIGRDPQTWQTFADPEGAKLRVLAGLVDRAHTHGARVKLVEFVSDVAPHLLGEVPWPILNEIVDSYWGHGVRPLLASALAEIGDAEWEMFLVLAPEWQGTVAGLLGACRALPR